MTDRRRSSLYSGYGQLCRFYRGGMEATERKGNADVANETRAFLWNLDKRFER
jgi:hypothetical protein